MAIGREDATKVYRDHLEKRATADELSINLTLGELDAVSERTAKNEALPAHVRKDRLRDAINTLEGRTRNRTTEPSKTENRPSSDEDEDYSVDNVTQILSERFNLSAGEVAALRRMLSQDSTVKVSYDRDGNQSEVRRLQQELRQVTQERDEARNRLIVVPPSNQPATASPFAPRVQGLPTDVEQTKQQRTANQPAPADDNPADTTKTGTPPVQDDNPKATAADKKLTFGQRVRSGLSGTKAGE